MSDHKRKGRVADRYNLSEIENPEEAVATYHVGIRDS